MKCFGGFRGSRRYRVDQEIEIYNFRVVPDLQISKKVELLMIHMIMFCCFLIDVYCFVINEVFWRFGELSSIQGGSGNRDLQF